MRFLRTGSASALLLGAFAHAQTNPPAAPQIEQVQVRASTADLRRQSTTTAIVINRDELLRQGDSNLADILKRQPGITIDATPGKPAAIRMRGMGSGYAAIMINGVPAPAGFSLESISPDLIERIEILRAATAETSSQAVAGSINVVLRKAGAGQDEFKAGSAMVGGYAAPTVTAQHAGRAGTLSYAVSATLRRNENPISAVDTETGEETGQRAALLRRTAWFDHQVEDMLELAPRLSWQPDAIDGFSLQAYLRKRHIDNAKLEHETTVTGSPTAFPRAFTTYETRPSYGYAELGWTRRLDGGARLETRLSGYATRRAADFLYRGMDPGERLLETHRVASGPREREWTFKGTWRRPFGEGHALAVGWELGRKQRDEYRREHQFTFEGAELLSSDESYRATVGRSAFFVQDEWDITPAWSAYLGLRREDLHTTGAGNAAAPVDVDSGVWSPIAQALYKLEIDGSGRRDQLRLAVGRTYKAPNIIQLMPRRYTVDNNNSATNPDQQGNPNLKPELALGIDLAWERYLDKNSMLSVSAFHKRIRDVTLTRIYRNDGVWISTPDNLGGATVRGVEFEGKTSRGALAARVNLARNWSRLDAVPGPDNRIDGQPAWSGNLGADYARPSGAFDAGATFSYRGRYASRQSAVQASTGGVKRQLDLYAVWKRGRNGKLRLSVSDLLHQDYAEASIYMGDGYRARTTVFRTYPTWRVVWEQVL
jgi:outer membrane receptor protein involved in Fe transport